MEVKVKQPRSDAPFLPFCHYLFHSLEKKHTTIPYFTHWVTTKNQVKEIFHSFPQCHKLWGLIYPSPFLSFDNGMPGNPVWLPAPFSQVVRIIGPHHHRHSRLSQITVFFYYPPLERRQCRSPRFWIPIPLRELTVRQAGLITSSYLLPSEYCIVCMKINRLPFFFCSWFVIHIWPLQSWCSNESADYSNDIWKSVEYAIVSLSSVHYIYNGFTLVILSLSLLAYIIFCIFEYQFLFNIIRNS